MTALLGGCGGGLRPFPNQPPIWRDPDRRSFDRVPEEYFSPFAWDAANQTVFRPISRFFAVDPAGDAVNVNALDEVPDSSWYENRIGRFGMTPEEAALGACQSPLPDVKGPWTVKAAKPNGFNPGFFIKASDGKRYLMKFDGRVEGPRPTAADVVSSRIFHAAGYFVPCNRVVYIERGILKIDPKAKSENAHGDKVALTPKDVDVVFSKALRLADGRYRASLSLFVEGQPIGPWTYEGRRSDDPNDVVNHEDRRELRGMEVMAAWLGFYDSREQNTLASFVKRDTGGYVRHYLIDVGNVLGSIWDPPALGRRITHAYYLDVPYLLEDFVTLGIQHRPWDDARFGPTGVTFGYFDVEHFDPDGFRSGYPNPAFVRRSERDSAWMARIIARYSDAHLASMVKMAGLEPRFEARLLDVLEGRRDKLLRRYLSRLSPLAWPELRPAGQGALLCFEDLAVLSQTARAQRRSYETRGWQSTELLPVSPGGAHGERGHHVCFALPRVPSASPGSPKYLIVDAIARTRGEKPTLPARVHLYHLGGSDYRIVGLERPYSDRPPSG